MAKQKKRKPWWFKALIVLLVICLIPFVLYYGMVASSWTHNVIHTYQTKKYVAENFPDQEFNVDFAKYDWYDVYRYCNVWSETSPDTRFQVWKEKDSSLADDYELSVTDRGTTYARLEEEASEEAERRLSERYLHAYERVSCEFKDETLEDKTLLRQALTLDMPLDMKNPPLPLVLRMSFALEDGKSSADMIKERLRELPEIADALGMEISFFSVEIWEGASDWDRWEIKDVPKEIILSDRLDDYVDANIEDRRFWV